MNMSQQNQEQSNIELDYPEFQLLQFLVINYKIIMLKTGKKGGTKTWRKE
jgi:hypothetical protein